MGGQKGSYTSGTGYSCEQAVLVEGWRKIWSSTPGTTDPLVRVGPRHIAIEGQGTGCCVTQ